MNFFLGCAVWSYKGWVGNFYPAKSRQSDFLRLYSQRLTTVEGNTTFYAIPDKNTVARWAEQTPPEFQFCLKLPKDLTHKGLLQPSIPGALNFLEQMRGLDDRLGPIFAQLPPSYSPELYDDLSNFLTAWPRSEAPLALEVRHRDWFKKPHAEKLTNLLQNLGVGRVLLDSRPIYSGANDPQVQLERRKPQLPLQPSITTSFSLIRFISHPNKEVNQPFLTEWVTQIKEWLDRGTRIYFFVHCPIEENSPHTARYFQELLEKNGVAVPPLPWNDIDGTATQLSLF